MTDIILSIHPKWAKKIYNGEKTVEVRKTEPDWFSSSPGLRTLIYLYETTPIKKITGLVFLHWSSREDKAVIENCWKYPNNRIVRESCLTREELVKYSNGKDLYLWELKDPFKFDTPQDIKGSVPQSWRYLKEGERYD
jgi:predicted transcriptional regulator